MSNGHTDDPLLFVNESVEAVLASNASTELVPNIGMTPEMEERMRQIQEAEWKLIEIQEARPDPEIREISRDVWKDWNKNIK